MNYNFVVISVIKVINNLFIHFHKLPAYLINPKENLEIYSNGLYKLGILFSSWIFNMLG